jgi:hypothetical protein
LSQAKRCAHRKYNQQKKEITQTANHFITPEGKLNV